MEQRINFNVPIENSVRNESGDFLIKGAAINEGTTRNDVLYSGKELKKAAPTLKNVPILKDHTNSVDFIVGRTTENIKYSNVNNRIDFEGQIHDERMQSMIEDGRINAVSVGCIVRSITPVLDKKDEPTGVIEAKNIEFVELSLVAVPADPGAGFSKSLMEACKTEAAKKNPKKKEKEKEKDDEKCGPKRKKSAIKFKCECIKCGFKTIIEKHCVDIKCTKCGGQMRRQSRPGTGKSSYSIIVPLGEKVTITLPNNRTKEAI